MRKFLSALAGVGLVAVLSFGSGPAAQASQTGTVTTSATGIARGAVLPSFDVTVGFTPENTISGASFKIFDTWGMNKSLQTASAGIPLTTAGQCGIESMHDGNNVSLPFDGTYSCSYKANGSSSYSNHISVYPTVTADALTVTQPLTVTFSAGVFTAPKSASATTPMRVLARNDDVGSTGVTVLNFTLIDAVTTPETQWISCGIEEPIESKPLTTVGMNGTVEYAFVDDPPAGIIIDPVTGVISGTPAVLIDPVEWLVAVTSSTGQIGSVHINVNKPLPDTGVDGQPLAWTGGVLLLLGFVATGIAAVARVRRAKG